jgi:hypothetical protein
VPIPSTPNREFADLSVSDYQSAPFSQQQDPSSPDGRQAYTKPSFSPGPSPSHTTTTERRQLLVTSDQLMANGTPTNAAGETSTGQFFGSDFARNGPLIENIFEVEVPDSLSLSMCVSLSLSLYIYIYISFSISLCLSLSLSLSLSTIFMSDLKQQRESPDCGRRELGMDSFQEDADECCRGLLKAYAQRYHRK